MSDPAVDVQRLIVKREEREILRLNQLCINSGQVVVILGPNGAGKSTLLKCLLGVVRPTTGEIRVLGRTVWPRQGRSLCRLRCRIGYVPQTLAAHSETPLTVREVAAIGRTGIAGLFRPLSAADWQIVDQWLSTLGLAALADKAYASLSGGEQRKTLVAKAMVQCPEILLFDEPTANLDLYWREQIVETLHVLHKDTRLTIVLVCHELEVIPACADRLLVLQHGSLIADGRPEEVLTPELVQSLFGTRLKLIASDGRYIVAPMGDARYD